MMLDRPVGDSFTLPKGLFTDSYTVGASTTKRSTTAKQLTEYGDRSKQCLAQWDPN